MLWLFVEEFTWHQPLRGVKPLFLMLWSLCDIVAAIVDAFVVGMSSIDMSWITLNSTTFTKQPTTQIEDLDKMVLCRCWKSSKFPLCDGAHGDHNKCCHDNVGPLVVLNDLKKEDKEE